MHLSRTHFTSRRSDRSICCSWYEGRKAVYPSKGCFPIPPPVPVLQIREQSEFLHCQEAPGLSLKPLQRQTDDTKQKTVRS